MKMGHMARKSRLDQSEAISSMWSCTPPHPRARVRRKAYGLRLERTAGCLGYGLDGGLG